MVIFLVSIALGMLALLAFGARGLVAIGAMSVALDTSAAVLVSGLGYAVITAAIVIAGYNTGAIAAMVGRTVALSFRRKARLT